MRIITCCLVVCGFAIIGCGDDGVGNRIDAPPAPDAAIDAPIDAPVCIAPTGAGTMHGSITVDETWTAAASPHKLPFDTSVNATITIEPCAIVQIGDKKTITIGVTGAIVAQGAPGQPVTFERLVPATPWTSIRAIGGSMSFTHTIIRGGGDPGNAPLVTGALLMQRSPTATTGAFHVDDVELVDSASQGLYMPSAVGFDATSQNFRVHGSAGAPIHTYARVLGSIPTGDYTGNGVDEIIISGSGGAVIETQTMHARGVPYHVGTAANAFLDVAALGGTPVAILTIEPGVTIKFEVGGRLRVEPASGLSAAQGALIAIGTAAQPIVFTSAAATPVAGDWNGIWFGGTNHPMTAIQHARVEFAGGQSASGGNSCTYPTRGTTAWTTNDAAIRIFGTTAPGGQFVTDTEIVSSARDGIDRGWRDDPAPDFLGTNTFTNVAGCKQTTPRTFAGVCPTTPPCP